VGRASSLSPKKEGFGYLAKMPTKKSSIIGTQSGALQIFQGVSFLYISGKEENPPPTEGKKILRRGGPSPRGKGGL